MRGNIIAVNHLSWKRDGLFEQQSLKTLRAVLTAGVIKVNTEQIICVPYTSLFPLFKGYAQDQCTVL